MGHIHRFHPATMMPTRRRLPHSFFHPDTAFPTSLAAKLAISVQLSRPLGGLPDADRAFIDALLAETLDRQTVAARVREHFKKPGRG
jgi:hypothetical protein